MLGDVLLRAAHFLAVQTQFHLPAVALKLFAILADNSSSLSSLLSQVEQEEERAEASRLQRLVGAGGAPGGGAAADTKLSVVKKFFARLDRRLDSIAAGRPGAAGERGGSAEEAGVSDGGEEGAAEAAATAANLEAVSCGGASTSLGGVSGAAPQVGNGGGRAGNHSIPDASDAPLLLDAAVGGGTGGSMIASTVPSAIAAGHGGPGSATTRGSYVPPSVPLFPEVSCSRELCIRA
jgi:hypothetical protein